VISDFSKALCLSGLRVGWIVDHDPKRRERCRNARNYFTITGNVLGERLAVLALKHREAVYSRARRVTVENLKLLEQLLGSYEELVRWVRPRGGMTAFPWLMNGDDSREFCRRLARMGVLIVPGDCFDQPSHFRLGFAASGEHFSPAIERFAQFLHAESKTSRAY